MLHVHGIKRGYSRWFTAVLALVPLWKFLSHAQLLVASASSTGDEEPSATGTGSNSSSLTTVDDLEVEHVDDDVDGEGLGGHSEVYAVLFPWVAQVFGIVIYFLLTRGLHAIPYTGVLFVVGTCMGAGASRTGLDDQLTQSIAMWIGISHRVLFCTFLPGLLFKDALDINFHLFVTSFWQIMYLAFPMVLAGTYLTALVGVYVFPYGWTMNLALTFGSILAATDPVAVCVLLNEVCAPPRLRMHISGEALWNDGSAVVFYSVFSTLFLYELNVGLGKDVDVADGFAIFFRMSLGGVVVGLVFSIALIFILYKLNRRLDGEEKVLQVASTVTVAYLTFYVSDVICHVSGVIGVVVLGTITKAFGGSFINDWQVMQSFWSLLEHLLNTVLFTLGGVEFGRVVASGDGLWEARDWGYLVALYILVSIIRFGSLIASYPLLVRIGLGTNWQETVFSGWAGLRGAVGITLALGLHSETLSATGDPQKTELTNKVFGMVAGVAFLTLLINGPLSGPLLVKLGLVDTSEARKRIIQAAEVAARRRILGDFLHLMTDPRFSFVDFALVRHHCPLLSNLTAEELEYAMRENKESVNPALYKQPKLNHVFPYIEGSARLRVAMERMMREAFMRGDLREQDAVFSSIDDIVNATNSVDDSTHVDGEAQVERNEPNPDLVKDIRIMFVELLRSAYHAQIQAGELDSREYHGFLAYVLLQSLDFAHDSAIAGVPLDDWRASQIASPELVEKVEDACHRIYNFCCFRKKVDSDLRKSKTTRLMTLRDERPLKYQLYRLDVLRAFSFIDAHMEAQDRLQEEFGKESGDLFLAFRTVLQESKSQIRKAGEILRTANKKQLKHVISHHLCLILQGKTARYYQLLHDSGILSAREAHHYLHEIDRQVISIRKCGLDKHPGSIDYADETHLVNEDSAHLLPRRRRKKQKSLL